MLISSQTTLSLRCPNCGGLGFYALSRFCLGIGGSVEMHCECGKCLITVYHKSKKYYCLQVECMMCDTKHIINYTGSELWNNNVMNIVCENSGVEIGFAGTRDAVVQSIKRIDRSIGEVNDNGGYDKFFLSPEVMYQVLDFLGGLSEEGLMSCTCGGEQLEMAVYPDRVELYCNNCDAVGVIFAETVKDLQWIHSMEKVQLETHVYHCLDDKRLRKKPSR